MTIGLVQTILEGDVVFNLKKSTQTVTTQFGYTFYHTVFQ